MDTTADVLTTTVLESWKLVVQHANDALLNLTDEQLQLQVAPGRNRIYYLLGHLAAVHDRALPMLGNRDRLYPELDVNFIQAPDCATYDLELNDALKSAWVAINEAVTISCEKLTQLEWIEHHADVSAAGFMLTPRYNRLSILLSLTNHTSYHLGQIRLAL
jgi:DinB superfamily